MQPALDWISILLFVGAGHSVLLAVTLLNIRHGNRSANRIFAIILLVFAANISLHTFATSPLLLKFPHLSKVEPPLVFLFGPLFFLYVQVMTGSHARFNRNQLLHFIPFLACVLFLIPYYLQPTAAKIQHILADHQSTCAHCLLMYWFLVAHVLIYIIVIARRLNQHKKKIMESFSSVEKINLDWLRNLLIAASTTWFAALIMQLVSPTMQTGNFIWLLVSLNVYLIGYIGLRRPEVFSGENAAALAASEQRLKKYEKSTLTPEKAEAYLQKLDGFMLAEKPFLDGDLTLPALASKLSMATHHLSQVINQKLRQNFFEFVNSHRVEEAKKRISAPENIHLNLAEIGFEVGFNSISSFNAAFKKHAGMTPSQFRGLGVEA